MAPRCKWCGSPAFIWLEYARIAFCKKHFIDYFLRKVERTVKSYGLVEMGDRILVALSGGKDSASMFFALARLFSDVATLIPVTIDLGGEHPFFADYVEKVRKQCSLLGFEAKVVRLEEYGFTIDDIFRAQPITGRPICSACALVKRYILNDIARKLGTNKIALGHVLDDMAAYIMLNLISGDLHALSKLGPSSPARDALPARIRPLYEVYELETKALCEAAGIPYAGEDCPYSKGEKLGPFKDVMRQLERNRPASLLTFARNFAKKLLPLIKVEEAPLKKCSVCGAPTSSEVCAFCRLKAAVLKAKSKA